MTSFEEQFTESNIVFSRYTIAQLNQMIEQNPHSAEAYYNRARLFILAIYEKTNITFDKNDFPDSSISAIEREYFFEMLLSDLNKAIELDPQYTKAYLERSSIYECEERANEALDDLDKAIALGADKATAYALRTTILFNDERWAEALIDVNIALELGNNDTDTYLSKSYILEQLGEYTAAIEMSTIVIEKDSQCAQAYAARSNQYAQINDEENSRKDMAKARALYFNEAEEEVETYATYQPDDTSIESLTREIEEAKCNNEMLVFYYQMRGDIYDRENNYEAAIADYNEGLSIMEEKDSTLQISLYTARASTYASMKNKDAAIADYNQAIEIAESSGEELADAYAARASYYDIHEEYTLAIQDYNIAIQYKPDHYFNYFNRAQAYEKVGDYENALSDYEHVKRLNSDGNLYEYSLEKATASIAQILNMRQPKVGFFDKLKNMFR